MPIKVRSNGLELDGNLLPLFSGSFHYWRSPRGQWPHIFDQIRGLGFQVVETYVPWSVHETAPGEFDFGRTDPDKDLDAWLTLAHQRGFKVLLRPGPCINSELPDFGYPERILFDPSRAALGPLGNPVILSHQTSSFAVPSYADERLFADFDVYLGALSPLLQKHLYPKGPVVALQVDNEISYGFIPETYSLDYSPASLALWAHFLELKYRAPAALSRAWGAKVAGFEAAPAPRAAPKAADGPGGLRACLDWVEYREYQVQWALGRMADLYRSRGLGSVPFYHNFYGPWTTPFSVPDVEADAGVDFCGLDGYPHAADALEAVDQARYLASSSRLAYFPEYGAGSWPFGFPVRDQGDQEATLLAPLMGGAKGVNFYMLVERERWLGSPLGPDGARRGASADLFARFNAFLEQVQWPKTAPVNQGLLVLPREAQRLAAVFDRPTARAELEALPAALRRDPEADLLPGGGPLPRDCAAFHAAARAFCARGHYGFALADGAVVPERLARHAFVVAGIPGFCDEALARRLRSYAEGGGLLVVGPAWPRLNARFEPLRAFEGLDPQPGKPLPVGDGKVLLLGAFDAAAVAALLRRARIAVEIDLSDPELEAAVHRGGGRQLLFVRNPFASERRARVLKEGKFVLKPLWSGAKFLGAVEEREVVLGPHEIKVWEVIPA